MARGVKGCGLRTIPIKWKMIRRQQYWNYGAWYYRQRDKRIRKKQRQRKKKIARIIKTWIWIAVIIFILYLFI